MLECVLRVNEIAQENWEQYVAQEVTNMKGHLMPYPIKGTEMALLNHILATKYS
jgi:phospholipase D1/2